MKRKYRLNTPAKEAEIQRGIAQDPDNPEWTDEMFAKARPAAESLPSEFLTEQAVPRRGPQKSPTKQLVSLRLDRDVVERLRATGRGWQTHANELLRTALERSKQ